MLLLIVVLIIIWTEYLTFNRESFWKCYNKFTGWFIIIVGFIIAVGITLLGIYVGIQWWNL